MSDASTTIQGGDARPRRFGLSKSAATALGLIVILAVAFFARVGLLSDPLYEGDLEHFATWMNLMNRFGVLQFYNPTYRLGAWDRPYPQLSTLAFDAINIVYNHGPLTTVAMRDPYFITLLKMIPFLCDLVMVAAVYLWLRERLVLRWLIPGALAIYPGLVVVSAWWGQFESPFVMFLVLSLIALNSKRPALAWALFGLAVLIKQPAVVIGPLLLVVTFRRFGLKRTILSGIAFAVVFTAFVAPFALANTPRNALIPFLNASDAFPYLTNNAFNFWYALESIHKGTLPKFEDPRYGDHALLLGPLNFKTSGLLMFGIYVLIIMVIMWRQAHQNREFVWASALFLGYFLLLTQVHERYILPAALFSLIAISQDPRMAWIALGTAWTFSYNVLAVAVPNRWPDQTLGLPYLALPTAFLNIFMVIPTAWFALKSPQAGEPPAVHTATPVSGIPEPSIPAPAVS